VLEKILEDLRLTTSSYPYPLLGALDTTGRALVFTGSAIMMAGSTLVLRWLYGRVNGLTTAEKRSVPGNVKGE
jgi:hypothetical protein